jgi:hypothetical protein
MKDEKLLRRYLKGKGMKRNKRPAPIRKTCQIQYRRWRLRDQITAKTEKGDHMMNDKKKRKKNKDDEEEGGDLHPHNIGSYDLDFILQVLLLFNTNFCMLYMQQHSSCIQRL